MGLRRQSYHHVTGSIWPGFVDAMTALLLVLIFVLSIFLIVQFMQRETILNRETTIEMRDQKIATQNASLDFLGEQLSALDVQLGAAQAKNLSLEEALAFERTQIQSLRALTESQESEIVNFQNTVTELQALRADDAAKIDESSALLAELRALRADDAAKIDESSALLAELRALRADDAAKIDESSALLAELRALRADDAAKIDESSALLAELRALRADDAAKIDESSALLAELRALRADDAAKIDESSALLAELRALRADDATKIDEFSTKVTNLEADNAAYAVELSEKDKALSIARALAAQTQLKLINLKGLEAETQVQADSLRKQLQATKTELTKADELSAKSLRQIALLNAKTARLDSQLAALQNALDESLGKEKAANVQIELLGANLNAALARKAIEQRKRAEAEKKLRERLEAEAKELRDFRSEFFGRMRKLLVGRPGIQIKGDRFIFDSEVLFDSGEAKISELGKAEIAGITAILKEISNQIPPEIDWAIRVDGHTDDTPLRAGNQYANNWELSQARALAVVSYMIESKGLPADRLIAAGFGEFHPRAAGVGEDVRRKNRRIELKLTER